MKRFFSTILCLVIVLALVGCGASAIGGYEIETDTELWTITGRYCETTTGRSLLLSDTEGAICISSATEEEDLFVGFENGDLIQITVDGVAETYPAQAVVYDCTLLQKGAVEDLDSEALQRLVDMGWEFPFSVSISDGRLVK